MYDARGDALEINLHDDFRATVCVGMCTGLSRGDEEVLELFYWINRWREGGGSGDWPPEAASILVINARARGDVSLKFRRG